MNNVKKSIGWADYTINPIKGLCPVDCKDNQGKSYCYACRMYKRFKWNPKIRLTPLLDIHVPEGSRIFVGSTIELFGEWIKSEWLEYIFKWVHAHPYHTFIFLTKQPTELINWSPFPPNCFVGVSVTRNNQFRHAVYHLAHIKAEVKYISFEPLLEYIPMAAMPDFVNWVIIGQQTPIKKATMPKIEWIQKIVEACDKANIPVFLKNNLYPILGLGNGKSICHNNDIGTLRQEFPK